MEIYFIVLIILIISGISFGILVKILNYIPKTYHKSIQLMSSFGIVLIISGTFITYYKDQLEKAEKEKLEYADGILQSFSKIDDFLIQTYETNSIILSILYNGIQLPSSDVDLNSLFKKEDKKTKDILFIIYGKLTNIFEKMYLINPDLFNNDKLGVRVKLYTETIFYYEYWNTSKNIYNTNFVSFMNNKYKYLTLTDHRFNKPDRETYRIPYLADANFIFKSPTKDGLWY
jgi:predicted small secreted protein